MDLDHPGLLFSGMLISLIGVAMFMYGRKAEDARFVLFGVVLNIVPFLAHGLLLMWGLTGACCSGMYVLNRRG